MILGVMGSQVDVIPSHFFPQGFSINAADCKGVFCVSKGWPGTYQQAKMTPEWMIVHDHAIDKQEVNS